MTPRFREGDFLETVEGFIFDVKGLIHPPNRAVAYLRYVPDLNGNRVRLGVKYRKLYRLKDRENFLMENAPHYLFRDRVFNMEMQGVPLDRVQRVYKPELKVMQLLRMSSMDEIERQGLNFIKLLSAKSGVSMDYMGLSGSILVGLHGKNSDIDIVVYGRNNSFKVYEALGALIDSHPDVERYSYDDLTRLYTFRSMDTDIPFEAFIKVEAGKRVQGRFMGRDFFIRFIHDWCDLSEKYGDRVYKPLGFCTLRAEVVEDSESIFTPCRYGVHHVELLSGAKVNPVLIKEVCSFRGRFCEQASVGDVVRVSGKLERVREVGGETWFRVIVGGREGDYMIPERLLG